jgi:hypothetical protein
MDTIVKLGLIEPLGIMQNMILGFWHWYWRLTSLDINNLSF